MLYGTIASKLTAKIPKRIAVDMGIFWSLLLEWLMYLPVFCYNRNFNFKNEYCLFASVLSLYSIVVKINCSAHL